ncbi:MAG TPA: hypothetical protein DCF49_00915 [Lachnospiraceae bacterium]|nr:hypothetical protein [Lachnospiraceae bacterium]
MKIDPKELYSIGFYEYGEALYGSCGGMRYRVAIDPLKNVHYTPPDKRDPAVLLAKIWPEPFSYGATDPSLIKSREFPFSEKGLEEAVEWLNEQIAPGEE